MSFTDTFKLSEGRFVSTILPLPITAADAERVIEHTAALLADAVMVEALPNALKLGAFRFAFMPDGDDPGVGSVQISYDGELRGLAGVSEFDWRRFVEAAS